MSTRNNHDGAVANSGRTNEAKRLGAAVREARKNRGYTNQAAFAAASKVSLRVLATLETGERTNVSQSVLTRVEVGLGWPAGTIDQIVTDPAFVPSPQRPSPSGDLKFLPPRFDDRPVAVEVGSVLALLGALDGIAATDAVLSAATQRVAVSAVAVCWPYVVRLVEDNCRPAVELHPSIRPQYEALLALTEKFAAGDPSAPYARWLAGDDSEQSGSVRSRYQARLDGARRQRPEVRPRLA